MTTVGAELDCHKGLDTAEAINMLRRNGYVILRGVLDADLVSEWRAAFVDQNAGDLTPERSEHALQVGHLRKMLSVGLDGPFAEPAFWGSPDILSLAQAVLGPLMTLDSATCVVSFPGARAQKVHADHPPLFDAPVGRMLPAFALSVFVPLVPADRQTGSTHVLRGSHVAVKNPENPTLDAPELAVGDVMVVDYRSVHQGAANLSDRVRPLVTLVYSKPWFRDSVNFKVQEPLKLGEGFWDGLADAHKPLFAKAQKPVSNFGFDMDMETGAQKY